MRRILIAAGFLGVAFVLVCAREFFVTFRGSDLAFLAAMASWGIWGAATSVLARQHVIEPRKGVSDAAICMLVFGMAVPLSILAIRCVVQPTDHVLFAKALLTISSITCIPSIALFTILFRLAGGWVTDSENALDTPNLAAPIFLLGLAVGGMLTSYLIVQLVGTWAYAIALAVSGCVGAVSLALTAKSQPMTIFVGAMFAFGLVSMQCSFLGPSLNHLTQCKRYEAVGHVWESPSAQISTISRNGESVVLRNGERLSRLPDEVATEYDHLAMLEHPKKAENVLLIDAFVPSNALAILRHHPSRLTWLPVESSVVFAGGEAIPPPPVMAAAGRTKVVIIGGDVREVVTSLQGPLDVVILFAGETNSGLAARLYSSSFLKLLFQKLAPDGVIVIVTDVSPERFQADPGARDLVRHLLITTKRSSLQTWLIPWPALAVLASGPKSTIATDVGKLKKRWGSRRLPARTWRYAQRMMSRQLCAEALKLLDKGPVPRQTPTRDIAQLAFGGETRFFMATVFGTRHSGEGLPGWSPRLTVMISVVAWVVLGFLLGSMGRMAGGPMTFSFAAAACAAGTGGAMALAGLMLQYQDLFGSLYSRMGVLAGGYFLGMLVGNLIMINQAWSERRASMMSFFCFVAVIFFVVLGFALGAIEHPSLRWLRTLREIVFPFVAVLSGLWAGFVAPQCDASNLLGYQNLRKLVGAQWLGFALGMIVAAQIYLPMGGADGTFGAAAGPFLGALLILVLARTMDDGADELGAD